MILIVIGSSGAFALHNQEQKVSNPLLQASLDTDARPMKLTEVINIVTNMLNGEVTASKAHDYIFDEKFFAKKDGDTLSGKELDQNKRYIEFLNAADAVVTAYMYDSPDVKDKVAEMEAKKELI